jgi:hypothetical protein
MPNSFLKVPSEKNLASKGQKIKLQTTKYKLQANYKLQITNHKPELKRPL